MVTSSIADDKESSQQWNYHRNTEINLKTISLKSRKKVWWICEKKHEWQTSVYNRIAEKGCPYCSNINETHDILESEENVKISLDNGNIFELILRMDGFLSQKMLMLDTGELKAKNVEYVLKIN